MDTLESCIAESEQSIQEILEKNEDELKEFIFDNNINYHKVKAFISFHLAIHYALRAINKS